MILGSTQFNIVMHGVIKDVKRQETCYQVLKSLKILCYAGAAALIAEDEDDLQHTFFRFKNISERYNMIISTEK